MMANKNKSIQVSYAVESLKDNIKIFDSTTQAYKSGKVNIAMSQDGKYDFKFYFTKMGYYPKKFIFHVPEYDQNNIFVKYIDLPLEIKDSNSISEKYFIENTQKRDYIKEMHNI